MENKCGNQRNTVRDAKMATVCERLVPWMRTALGTTLPQVLVEEYSSQGVWVEKMFY